ncbi:MAG: dihydrofolate reductase family protein [Vicinamibacterales bacterium]
MKTQYYTASSLDGFIAAPGHSLDWLMQFGHGAGTSFEEFIREVGAVAMGSGTYEWLLRHHVFPEGRPAQPWPHEQPTWVFTSRTLRPVPGADIRFVSGAVAPVHRDMVAAAGGRNIWLCGGGDLVGQFHDAGRLDELIVQIAAVTLGAGAPLRPRASTTPPRRLVSARAYGTAIVEVRYEVTRA